MTSSRLAITAAVATAAGALATGLLAAPPATAAPASIGDRVWRDVDGDGVQDPGEHGVTGVQVQLWNGAMNSLLAIAYTDGAGTYHLASHDPPDSGDYRVRVILPDAHSFSPKDVGADTTDSDINISGVAVGFSDPFALSGSTTSVTSWDAGLVPAEPGSVHLTRTFAGNAYVPASTAVPVTYDCGDGGSGTLRPRPTLVLGGLIVGDECRFTAGTPSAIRGVRWTDVSWEPSSTVTVTMNATTSNRVFVVVTVTARAVAFVRSITLSAKRFVKRPKVKVTLSRTSAGSWPRGVVQLRAKGELVASARLVGASKGKATLKLAKRQTPIKVRALYLGNSSTSPVTSRALKVKPRR